MYIFDRVQITIHNRTSTKGLSVVMNNDDIKHFGLSFFHSIKRESIVKFYVYLNYYHDMSKIHFRCWNLLTDTPVIHINNSILDAH